MQKSFKEWYQQEISNELTEDPSKATPMQNVDAYVDKVAEDTAHHSAVVDKSVKPVEIQKKVEAPTEKKTEEPDKKDTKLPDEEFTPSWRQKTIQELDNHAKRKNIFNQIFFYTVYALVMLSIVVASYLVWENFVKDGAKSIDGPYEETPDKDDDTDGASGGGSTKKDQEISYYMVEIGVAGNREAKAGEIETDCGDILVPVTESISFENSSLKNGEVTDIALLKGSLETLLSYSDPVYDSEKNLSNSLSNSELTVKRVLHISDEYIVELEGTVDSIGECDSKRIALQIEESAKLNLPDTEITFKLNGSTEDYDKIKDPS